MEQKINRKLRNSDGLALSLQNQAILLSASGKENEAMELLK